MVALLARGDAAGGLATIAGTGRRSRRLVKLLLVTQQHIATGEASIAFRTLEGFLLGVGALVSLEMFQSGERPLAGAANVRARLIRLGRREISRVIVGGGHAKDGCVGRRGIGHGD